MRQPRSAAGAALLVLLSFASPTFAADADPVQRAIDRGVAALKKSMKGIPREGQPNPKARGVGKMGEMQVGMIALATLTLLECDTPAADPLIDKRLPKLRQDSLTATHTYTIATLLLLFDKVGDPDDVPLIHSLALRLLAGQYYAGGWSYYCPPETPAEVKRLAAMLKERPPTPAKDRKMVERDGRDPPALPEDVLKRLKALANQRRDVVPNRDNFQGRGDDSNTQFAVLGLWVARRYGIPVGPAMATVEARFRKSQNGDGGWGYVPAVRGEATKDTGSTPSMTCAGLMVLGMGYGTAAENALRENPRADVPDLAKDPAVRGGFAFLAGQMAQPRPKGFVQSGYYYLWSLERVGVGYNLRVIGNKDWYPAGATMLVASQEQDGYWQNEYGPVIDTCFALLFLKRVNLVKDLTKELKGVQSLGETTRESLKSSK